MITAIRTYSSWDSSRDGQQYTVSCATALPWQRRGPEGAVTTRSGPDNMFRFEVIRLRSDVHHRRNHLGRRHHHRSHGAWPRLR